jgi:hypothetical protein
VNLRQKGTGLRDSGQGHELTALWKLEAGILLCTDYAHNPQSFLQKTLRSIIWTMGYGDRRRTVPLSNNWIQTTRAPRVDHAC